MTSLDPSLEDFVSRNAYRTVSRHANQKMNLRRGGGRGKLTHFTPMTGFLGTPSGGEISLVQRTENGSSRDIPGNRPQLMPGAVILRIRRLENKLGEVVAHE